MCAFGPKIKPPPPAAQFQQVQAPKDFQDGNRNRLRRRGMWAAIMTSPSGLSSPPVTTGGSASVTGA